MPLLWLAILGTTGALELSGCGGDKTVQEVALERKLAVGGIQTNLSESTVTDTGWTLCYQGTYDQLGTPLSAMSTDCGGRFLMLACLPTGATTFTVAAADFKEDVIFDTGTGNASSFHAGHGVNWYYADNWSWGFFDPADGINKNSCDTGSTPNNFPGHRLCWHTGAGAVQAGYLCGTNISLFINSWERRVYSHL